MKKIITIIITVIFSTQLLAQGPWTRDKGKAYLQLGFTGLYYDKVQYNGSEKQLSNQVSDLTIQLYGEYGIGKRLEFQLIIPFKSVSYESKIGAPTENLTGVSNVSVGLKYKLYDQKWKFSTGLLFSANSISKDNQIGLSSGFNAATVFPYFVVGSSSNKWFYYANIGYGYMNNEYSDYIKSSFEIGYNVITNGHIMLDFESRSIVSKEVGFENDVFQWASYYDRQTYNAIGIKGNYEFKKDKLGVNIALIGAAAIDNAPLAPTFNFGIYSKF